MNQKTKLLCVLTVVFAFACGYEEKKSDAAPPEEPVVYIECLGVSKTKIKSGEPFTLRDRIRFLDPLRNGNRVVISETDIRNLTFGPFFHKYGLNIKKKRLQDGEQVWIIEHTLRLWHEKKGKYKIPARIYSYRVERPGETLANVKPDTASAPAWTVDYISVIPDDYRAYHTLFELDVKDEWEFPDFKKRYLLFGIGTVFTALALIWWTIRCIRYFRQTDRQRIPLTFRIRNRLEKNPLFFKRRLANLQTAETLKRALKSFIAKRAGIPNPETKIPEEILADIKQSNIKGPVRETLIRLAQKLIRYQYNIDSGQNVDTKKETEELRKILNGFALQARISYHIFRLTTQSQKIIKAVKHVFSVPAKRAISFLAKRIGRKQK